MIRAAIQPTEGHVDFDLHSLVGVRLVDASPSDAAAVARQLGPLQSPLGREPDVTIRFVDQIPVRGPLHFLGVDDVAFTRDAFFVLRSKHKMHSLVQIPFDQVGGQCEIVCQHGVNAVPLLIPILNLTALSKGCVPLHAAAFNYQGKGVLVTGWSKGGKTETLLAFMANGAQYIGDEWVYLHEDGQHMSGIPEPLRLWDWHLRDLPTFRAVVGRKNLARMQLTRWLSRSVDWANHRGQRNRASLLGRLLPIIQRQQCVDLPAEVLFPAAVSPRTGTVDKIFFVGSDEASEMTILPIDPRSIAKRMAFSLQEERCEFMSYYRKFRFAFPDRKNQHIDRAPALEREQLERLLAGKESYAVHHPYPVSIPALYEALHPFVTSGEVHHV